MGDSNLIEYALLIGFAMFIFLTIVAIVVSIIDPNGSMTNAFWGLI